MHHALGMLTHPRDCSCRCQAGLSEEPEPLAWWDLHEQWSECLYIHTHVYTYIYIYIYAYMYTHISVYIYTCIHTYMHIYVYEYVFIQRFKSPRTLEHDRPTSRSSWPLLCSSHQPTSAKVFALGVCFWVFLRLILHSSFLDL